MPARVLLCVLLTLLYPICLPAALTWETILKDDRLLPPKVVMTRDCKVDWNGPHGSLGTFELKTGTTVATVRASEQSLSVRYPGLVHLPPLERTMFNDLTDTADGSSPASAELKESVQIQLAGPEGQPGPLLQLASGARLPVRALTATHVQLPELTLAGSIPWDTTNILEAAATHQAEIQEDIERQDAREQQDQQLQRIQESTKSSSPAIEKITVKINTSSTFQTIDGFGTCLITWDKDIEKFYQSNEFEKAYIQDFGFNILRCELAPQSLPEPVSSPDKIKLSSLQTDKITSIFTDFGKRLKRKNPEALIIGTVWSPPPWMKANNSIFDPPLRASRGNGSITYNSYKNTQNFVKKEFYDHFAAWMVALTGLYEKEGAPLYAISPGNEVLFTQWFQSCVWTAEDYATITEKLRRALDKNDLKKMKIFGPETMTSHTFSNHPFLHTLMKTPGGKALDIFATHGYTDGVRGDTKAKSSSEFWSLIEKYDKPYWITEGGTGGHAWPEPVRPKGTAEFFHNNLVFGRASAIVPWQIVEKKADEHGQMLLTGYTKKSYTTMHFSRFIKPGSVRVQAEPAEGTLLASAYLHPTGSLTIVIVNPHPTTWDVDLAISGKTPSALRQWRTSANEDVKEIEAPTRGGKGWTLTLPPEAIVTLQGQ